MKKLKISRLLLASITMVCAIFAHTTQVMGASLYAGITDQMANVISEYNQQEKIELEAVITDVLGDAPDVEIYNIPEYKGMKSWMSYKSITSKSSPQYKLQQYAWTDEYGLRRIDDRYCIAIGTHFNAPVGQYVNLILENDMWVPCIVSDIKADIHTDASNIFTSNGCCSEYLIDPQQLNEKIKQMGDCSYRSQLWDSPVKQIEVIERNFFDEEED